MLISMIAAIDKNGAIGKDGKLPWNIPSDLKMFKNYTMGKAIVMGYNTFLSLPSILNGRHNVILTNKSNLSELQIAAEKFVSKYMDDENKKTTTVFRITCPLDLFVYVNYCEKIGISPPEEICIIGGEQTYKTFMPHADKLIISHIDTAIEDCDRFFPSIDASWKENCIIENNKDSKDEYAYTVKEYVRSSAEIYHIKNGIKLNRLQRLALQEGIKF